MFQFPFLQNPLIRSLGAGWHSLSMLRRKPCALPLRCRDFLDILNQAERFADWKASIPRQIVSQNGREGAEWPMSPKGNWAPILCRDEPQPGLFAEFVIVRQSALSGRVECLVHRCIRDQLQLLDELSLPDAFPAGQSPFHSLGLICFWKFD